MRYLGLDLGSSFFKGAVLDLEAHTLSQITRAAAPKPVAGLDPAFREFAPGAMLAQARALLEQLHDAAPDAEGVLMCSQLHGLILCGGKGRELSRFISWQDQRALLPLPGAAHSCMEEIDRLLSPEERLGLGNERVPGLPLNYLFSLARHQALPKSSAMAVSLPYFVAAHLCSTEPVTDVTHACGHGALDIRTLDWHRPVITKLGLDGVRWPQIVPQGTVIGEWAHRGRRLPVFAPVGDYHCSQAGALLEPGELSINISTGSAVIRIAEACESGDYQTRPWFDGRYLKTITHIPAGRALNAMVRLLTELASAQGVALDEPWDYIMAEAERSDGGGLEADPAFYASSMGHRGAVRHLREENMTVGHLFRALCTGMADNYAAATARVAPSRDWSRLVYSGGVARKFRLLRELIGARLGAAHRFAPSEEDTLFGLLVLARAFTGLEPSVQAAIAAMRARQPLSPVSTIS